MSSCQRVGTPNVPESLFRVINAATGATGGHCYHSISGVSRNYRSFISRDWRQQWREIEEVQIFLPDGGNFQGAVVFGSRRLTLVGRHGFINSINNESNGWRTKGINECILGSQWTPI